MCEYTIHPILLSCLSKGGWINDFLTCRCTDFYRRIFFLWINNLNSCSFILRSNICVIHLTNVLEHVITTISFKEFGNVFVTMNGFYTRYKTDVGARAPSSGEGQEDSGARRRSFRCDGTPHNTLSDARLFDRPK